MSKVLLVEDDNNLREIYEARLQAEGYDIAAAQDGEQALVVAKEMQPDLIISDVMMPKISGFEMLDILRNTEGLKNTRVIMLTALGQAEDKTRADSLGADRYLVKSQVTLEDIVKAAHQILDDPIEVQDGEPTVAPPAQAAPATQAAQPTPSVATSTPTTSAEVTPVVTAAQQPTPATMPTANPTPAPQAAQPQIIAPPPVEPVQAAPAAPATNVVAAPVSVEPVAPAQPVVEPVAQAAAESTTPTITVANPTLAAPVQPVTAAQTDNDIPAINVDPETGTLASEQAVVDQQIQDFVNTPVADGSSQDAASVNAAADDQLIAEAVEDLSEASHTEPAAAPSQATVVQPTTPTVEAPQPVAAPQAVPAPAPNDDDSSDNVTVAHKKIIQPLETEAKPDIHELLAKEEAIQAATVPAPAPTPIVNGTPIAATTPSPAPATQVHQPTQAVSPQSASVTPQPSQPIAAPAPQVTPTPTPAPAPAPSRTDGFDPNTVAL